MLGLFHGSFYNIILIVFFKSAEYDDDIGFLTPLYTLSLREFIFVATYGGYNVAILYKIAPNDQISTFSS